MIQPIGCVENFQRSLTLTPGSTPPNPNHNRVVARQLLHFILKLLVDTEDMSLREFYQVTLRKKVYESIEDLGADLDNWLNYDNIERAHKMLPW